MLVTRPDWVRHPGYPILSIDIHPDGTRVATAGGDNKVRVWNMAPIIDAEAERDPLVPKSLATLSEHFGPVNVVRWSHDGRYVASGSDDKLIFIHERKAGSAATAFGSSDAPDVENWKTIYTLRGHTADVIDLNWSPDDSMIASCSLDNTVRIWRIAPGSIHTPIVLTEHTSLVKGVSWDPIGSFLASQSDDKTVIVWSTTDWSVVARVMGPYEKTIGATFFRRLDWSPEGHFLTTTNSFEAPSHTAAVVERGKWEKCFDFVGHNAPVIAVKYNHAMFRRRGKQTPYNCIAIGSQDCKLSVWITNRPKALIIARQFFTQGIGDLSWSPDGFSLLACSNDGTVSSFTFDENELGVMLTKPEMDVILKERYGDLKWGKRLAIAESPAQLFLEQAATLANSKVAAPSANGHLQAPERSETESLNQAKPSVNGAVANGQREGQLTPAPATRMLPPVTPQGSPSRIQLGPVKQTEERRPDGRRRIIPQALRPMTGPSIPQPVWSSPPQEQSTGLVGVNDLQRSASAPEPNRDVSQPGVGGDNRVRIAPTPLGVKRPAEAVTQSEASKKSRVGADESAMDRATQAVVARTGPLPSVPGFDAKSSQAISGRLETRRITPVPDSTAQAAPLAANQVTARVDVNQTLAPVITVPRAKDGLLAVRVSGTDQDGGPPLVLESRDGSGGAAASSELVCSCGGKVRWKDRVRGRVSVLAGNSNMWAAAISDGSLIVYSSAGRRILPPLQLGAPAAFLVVGPGEGDRRWRLMVVTTAGRLFLWDLQKQECLAQETLAPLLRGSASVVSLRFSKTGAPLVVLSNREAHMFHLGMRCWLRIVDESFPASDFASVREHGVPSREKEDLAALHAEVGATGRGRRVVFNPLLDISTAEGQAQSRAHLEAQMAAAIAMNSPGEYKRWLLAYVRHLTREADEGRLRELCQELLGPGSGGDHADDAQVLGMPKRSLLETVVLPAMSANRAVQRLLNEFLDLIQ